MRTAFPNMKRTQPFLQVFVDLRCRIGHDTGRPTPRSASPRLASRRHPIVLDLHFETDKAISAYAEEARRCRHIVI